jgi:hypothetical protein
MTPIVLNPHLIDQLLKLRDLSTAGSHVSSQAYIDALQQLKETLNLVPRSPQSTQAAAGDIMEPYLIQRLWSNLPSDKRLETGRFMPPIHAGKGIFITGKPDAVIMQHKGRAWKPIEVADIKTTYRQGLNAPSQEDFINKTMGERLQSYIRSTQSAYSTALGVPQSYRMFGFESAADIVGGKVSASEAAVAPYTKSAFDIQMSLAEVKKRAHTAVAFAQTLGPDIWGAIQNRYNKGTNGTVFQKQVMDPARAWVQDYGIMSASMRALLMGGSSKYAELREAMEKAEIEGVIRQQEFDDNNPHKYRGGPKLDTNLPIGSDPIPGFATPAEEREDTIRALQEVLSTPEMYNTPEGLDLAKDIARGMGVHSTIELDKPEPKIKTKGSDSFRKTSWSPHESSWDRRVRSKELSWQMHYGDQTRYPGVDNPWSLTTWDWGSHGRNEFLDRAWQAADIESGLKDQAAFEKTRADKAFSFRLKGDEFSASTIEATDSMENLRDVLIDLAKASRDATDASKRQAEAKEKEKAFFSHSVSTLQNIKFYDWTRWNPAREEALSNVQSAFNWMPGSNVLSRMTTSAQQLVSANYQTAKGDWETARNTLGALGAGVLASPVGKTAPGFIASAVLAGGAALSQYIGNRGEAKIRSDGLTASSIGNRYGAIFQAGELGLDAYMKWNSIIMKVALTPLELFGKALKTAVPLVMNLGRAAMGALGGGHLGAPMLSMTGGVYGDYQASLFADAWHGTSQGTTWGMYEAQASRTAGARFGRIDQTMLIDAILSGGGSMIQSLFFNRSGTSQEQVADIINRYADMKLDRTKMSLLANSNPAIAQAVQDLGQFRLTPGQERATYQHMTDPSRLGIAYAKFDSSQYNEFRDQQFGYRSMLQTIDIEKIRMADTLWKRFGKDVLQLTKSFVSWVADLPKGVSLIDVIRHGLADLLEMSLPLFEQLKGGFAGFLHNVIDGVANLAPTLIPTFTNIFNTISDMGIDLVFTLGETLWSKFRDIVAKFSEIRIDPTALIDALLGKGSLGDIFKRAEITATPTEDWDYKSLQRRTLRDGKTTGWTVNKKVGIWDSPYDINPVGSKMADIVMDYYDQWSKNGAVAMLGPAGDPRNWVTNITSQGMGGFGSFTQAIAYNKSLDPNYVYYPKEMIERLEAAAAEADIMSSTVWTDETRAAAKGAVRFSNEAFASSLLANSSAITQALHATVEIILKDDSGAIIAKEIITGLRGESKRVDARQKAKEQQAKTAARGLTREFAQVGNLLTGSYTFNPQPE